jgi:hypothetical protein
MAGSPLKDRQLDDERTVRRLEAFSDTVIGFSLAQLGASLAFTNAMTLGAGGIASLIFSFAIICSLWSSTIGSSDNILCRRASLAARRMYGAG